MILEQRQGGILSAFFSKTLPELEAYCQSHGWSPRHGVRLMKWGYKTLAEDWLNLSQVPADLKADFSEHLPLLDGQAYISRDQRSGYDGSHKFLIQLADGQAIEAVLMPESRRLTLCLSSQVGCQQGCRFCHTARMGLIRQLDASEIVGQVVLANRWLKHHKPFLDLKVNQVTNLVFMGMGEPLDNVDQVSRAIAILTEPAGLNLPLSKIAVSTAGHLDGLKSLHARLPKVPLALSLHCSDNLRRSKLMPINQRFAIAEVLDYLRQHYIRLGGRHFLMVQYTVIRGVNDSLEDARGLADILSGIPTKINLIPFNDFAPSRFQSPESESLSLFRDQLHERGYRTMIRYSKGQDISAACGQLAHS